MRHLIQLRRVDWVNQMKKMNEAVGMKNSLTKAGGGKRLVRPFIRQELWKCIGCIISAVTYEKRGQKICRETRIFVGKKPQTKLIR